VRRQESDKRDATPNLFLKHRDATLADVLRQMKHLKHASETLEKTPGKHLKTIEKCTQYRDKTRATDV
jgi:hypothetical protein